MKKFHILIATLLFILTASVLLQPSLAGENYVGISEDDEYIWKVNIDEELVDEIFEDTEVYDNPSTSDDMYEDNNVFNEAKLINEGLHRWLNYSDDDWYKIYVERGNRLKVKLYDIQYWGFDPFEMYFFGNDSELYVYDSDGGLIRFSNYSMWESSYDYVEIKCNYTGYYYIQITNETINAPEGWASYFLWIDIIHYTPLVPKIDIRDYVKDFVEDYYDTEGVKMKIRKIRDEGYHKILDRWVKGVKVKCEIFRTEDFDDKHDWEEDDDIDEFIIVDSDETFYHRYLGLIIADDADWGDIADDVEIDYEQTKLQYQKHAETYAYDLKTVSSSERDNGLKIRLGFYNDDMDDINFYLDYDENGVLERGELEYGGVTVMTIELEKGWVDSFLGWLEEAFESGTAQLIIGGGIIAPIGIATAFIVGRKINKKRAERKLFIPPEME